MTRHSDSKLSLLTAGIIYGAGKAAAVEDWQRRMKEAGRWID